MKNVFVAIFTALLVTFALNALASENKDSVILDVRTPAEYSDLHVADSINIDFLNSNFKEEVSKLDRNKSYKLYCRSGNRSSKALEIMKQLNFKNVENLGSVQQAAEKLKRKCQPKEC